MKTVCPEMGTETNHSLEKVLRSRLWDAAIIGAGPAGAMAAYELAKNNQNVLLIDQAEFPRRKVCGGCLSRRALRELETSGLPHLARGLGAKPLRLFSLSSKGASAAIPIPEGAALSREKFDFALIQEAVKKGALFLPKTKAVVEAAQDNTIRVRVNRSEEKSSALARVALACDGLSGNSLNEFAGQETAVSRDSYMGISAVIDEKNSYSEEGRIHMVCAKSGYVGLVRNEDDRLEIASALSPAFLKFAGTPGRSVQMILEEAGAPVPEGLQAAEWQGTVTLTRKRNSLAGNRFFVLGDAAGYVEPLTGEGIYWALLQAKALAGLLRANRFEWNEKLTREWPEIHERLVGQRKKICGLVTNALKSSFFCEAAIQTMKHAPFLLSPLVRYIHGKDS